MRMVKIIKSRFMENGTELRPKEHYKYYLECDDVFFMDVDDNIAKSNEHIEVEIPFKFLEGFVHCLKKKIHNEIIEGEIDEVSKM